MIWRLKTGIHKAGRKMAYSHFNNKETVFTGKTVRDILVITDTSNNSAKAFLKCCGHVMIETVLD